MIRLFSISVEFISRITRRSSSAFCILGFSADVIPHAFFRWFGSAAIVLNSLRRPDLEWYFCMYFTPLITYASHASPSRT